MHRPATDEAGGEAPGLLVEGLPGDRTSDLPQADPHLAPVVGAAEGVALQSVDDGEVRLWVLGVGGGGEECQEEGCPVEEKGHTAEVRGLSAAKRPREAVGARSAAEKSIRYNPAAARPPQMWSLLAERAPGMAPASLGRQRH